MDISNGIVDAPPYVVPGVLAIVNAAVWVAVVAVASLAVSVSLSLLSNTLNILVPPPGA